MDRTQKEDEWRWPQCTKKKKIGDNWIVKKIQKQNKQKPPLPPIPLRRAQLRRKRDWSLRIKFAILPGLVALE